MLEESISDQESLKALDTVKEKRHNIYLLKYELSLEDHDFEYLTNALNKGVERGQYSAKERDSALEKNEDVWVMYALTMVKNGSPYHLWRSVLDKGIDSALISREEKSKAVMEGIQVQYGNVMDEARRNPKLPKSDVIAWLPSYCIR